jgi:hypothetical protein
VLSAVLFSFRPAYGQTESSLDLQYRFGYLTEASHAPNLINPFGPEAAGGVSAEHTFRMDYRHEIVPLFHVLSLEASLGLGYSIGNFTSDIFSGSQYTLRYRSTSVNGSAGIRYPFSDFAVVFSGWMELPLTQSLDESLLTNGNASIIASNGTIEYTRLPAGIRFDLDYAKLVFGTVPISVGLFGEFNLEAYRQSTSDAESGGIILSWNFESPSPENLADTIPIVPASAIPEVQAEVHFTENGKRIPADQAIQIEPRDTLVQQHAMLPSWMPLSNHSQIFDDHWGINGRSNFAIDSLARFNAQSIVKELPNILAVRLSRNPDVTLQFSAADSTNVLPVITYMEQTFGITGRKITFEAASEHRDRATIIPSDVALLSPISTQWIERSYAMKNIGIDHTIHPESSADNWAISIEQAGISTQILSSDSASTGAISLGIHPNSVLPIIAVMALTDNRGNTYHPTDTLLLSVAQSTPEARMPTLIRYILLADTTQIATIDRLIEEIKETSFGAQLSIDYYFDRSGLPVWFNDRLEKAGLHGTESSHALTEDDLGPRVVITILK